MSHAHLETIGITMTRRHFYYDPFVSFENVEMNDQAVSMKDCYNTYRRFQRSISRNSRLEDARMIKSIARMSHHAAAACWKGRALEFTDEIRIFLRTFMCF